MVSYLPEKSMVPGIRRVIYLYLSRQKLVYSGIFSSALQFQFGGFYCINIRDNLKYTKYLKNILKITQSVLI